VIVRDFSGYPLAVDPVEMQVIKRPPKTKKTYHRITTISIFQDRDVLGVHDPSDVRRANRFELGATYSWVAQASSTKRAPLFDLSPWPDSPDWVGPGRRRIPTSHVSATAFHLRPSLSPAFRPEPGPRHAARQLVLSRPRMAFQQGQSGGRTEGRMEEEGAQDKDGDGHSKE